MGNRFFGGWMTKVIRVSLKIRFSATNHPSLSHLRAVGGTAASTREILQDFFWI
jgi:hypothetical protein